MLGYKLEYLERVSPPLVQSYYDEFVRNGEECNVLWKLSYMDAFEFADECKADMSTRYFCFLLPNGTLAGIARITPNPNYIENGRMGYAIRPSERGKGYAPIMLRLIQDYCEKIKLYEVTACIDVNNEKSLAAFRKAGWVPTLTTFIWKGGRVAQEWIPKCFSSHKNNTTTADPTA